MTYIASPFFNRFDTTVRNRMLDALKDNGKTDIFLPDSTEASKSYDQHPSAELAVKIFEENITHIDNCSELAFPEYTDDCGTLMEVGYALGKCKTVLRYNYLNGSRVTILTTPKELADAYEQVKANPEKIIIDCNEASGAVILGYLYAKGLKGIKYLTAHDNIMLATVFTKVSLEGEHYVVDDKLFTEGM